MNEIFIWASTKISNCGFLASTNIIGPDITLKVMAGDSIQISGEVLYTPDPSGVLPARSFPIWYKPLSMLFRACHRFCPVKEAQS
jgi:hypothetical protein